MTKLIDIYIGRQPILDREKSVYGYEVFYRTGNRSNSIGTTLSECATPNVLVNLFSEFGLAEIAGVNNKVFINYTEFLLTSSREPFFAPNNIIIEILEDITITPQLIKSIKRLKELGFKIALDDYIFDPKLEPLEEFADIVKVDILQSEVTEISKHIDRLKQKNIILLAEKVETYEQFFTYKQLGFDLFQGYFFAKPDVISGGCLPIHDLTVIRLLEDIQNPNTNIRTLSKLISHDIALSHKILNILPNIYPNLCVSSIHEAILMFGMKRLQSLIMMIALSGTEEKPLEIYNTALIRAKFCELLGSKLKTHSKETYFTVGLFSVLDALYDITFEQLLSKTTLNTTIKNALITHDGLLGIALRCIKTIEAGDTHTSLPLGITSSELTKFYIKAVSETNEASHFQPIH